MTQRTPIRAEKRTGAADGMFRALPLIALLGVSGCGWAGDRLTAAAPDPALRLSTVFLSSGAAEAALRVADEVLARTPRSTAALEARGDALAALGRVEEAQDAYTRAIASNPSALGPRIALGRLLVRVDPPAAEAMFNDILARNPRNAAALNNLGVARDLQGRHADAQEAYRAALAADSAMSGASINLGLSLVLSGQMPEAVRTLRPLASGVTASPTVTENLAVALVASGETGEAERLLARSLPPDEVAAAIDTYRQMAAPSGAVGPTSAIPTAPPPAVAPSASLPATVETPVAAAPASAPATLAPSAQVAAAPLPVAPPRPQPVAAVVALATVPARAPGLDDIVVPAARRRGGGTPDATRQSGAAARSVSATAAPATVQQTPSPPDTDRPTTDQQVTDQPVTVRPDPVRLASIASAHPVQPVVEAAAPPAPLAADSAPAPARLGEEAAYAQLVLATSHARALETWASLLGRAPALLADREPVVVPGIHRGQPIWALRAGPFAETAEASRFCARAAAIGQDCWAMAPGARTSRREAAATGPSARPVAAAPAAPVAATAPVEPATPAAATASHADTPAQAGAPTLPGPSAASPSAPPTPSVAAVPEPVASSPRRGAGRVSYVQLAAAETSSGADAEWRRLRSRYSALLQDRAQLTIPVEVAGRTFWRLRTGPFQAANDAESFCMSLRASGGACWTASVEAGS